MTTPTDAAGLDTRWKPSPDQESLLREMLEEQSKEKNQADFVRKYIHFGSSKWSQILSVLEPPRFSSKGDLVLSYFDRISPAGRVAVFDDLREILDRIPLVRAEESRLEDSEVIKTDDIDLLCKSLAKCKDKPNAERAVVMLAPTGGGKTYACAYITKNMKARVVEVRSVWRRAETPMVPLRDICAAVGVRVGQGASAAKMQDMLVRYCQDRSVLLAFDEAEHFGREALNLLKFLLNKTRISVALFCIPEAWDKLVDYWPNEARQIRRRLHATIPSSQLKPKDIAPFFPKNQFYDAAKSLKYIADTANVFGRYSFVCRIAAHQNLRNVVDVVPSDVEEAGKETMKTMGGERV